jgi:hypothetical protein
LVPKLLKEMEEQMEKINKNLKASQDRQKSYVDKNIVFRDLKEGNMCF